LHGTGRSLRRVDIELGRGGSSKEENAERKRDLLRGGGDGHRLGGRGKTLNLGAQEQRQRPRRKSEKRKQLLREHVKGKMGGTIQGQKMTKEGWGSQNKKSETLNVEEKNRVREKKTRKKLIFLKKEDTKA